MTIVQLWIVIGMTSEQIVVYESKIIAYL